DDQRFIESIEELDRDLAKPRPRTALPTAAPRARNDSGEEELALLLDLFGAPGGYASGPPGLPLTGPPHLARRWFHDAPPAEQRPDIDASSTCETFYGFTEPPFSAAPDLKFLYHGDAHDSAAQGLLSAIGRHDRLIVLTGPSGVGKTMLCRALLEQLDRR